MHETGLRHQAAENPGIHEETTGKPFAVLFLLCSFFFHFDVFLQTFVKLFRVVYFISFFNFALDDNKKLRELCVQMDGFDGRVAPLGWFKSDVAGS